MKTFLLLALLCSLALQQQVVLLASSTTNTIITFPTGLTVGSDNYHNAVGNQPNYLGNGAQWIWLPGGSSWPHGQTLTFQTQFYADCNGIANLTITADNTFSAALNGGAPMTGNDWMKKYTFTLNPLKCGVNILVINATNLNDNSPAALIFSVTQDQSTCYNCLTRLASFNRQTCQCECNQGCFCSGVNTKYDWVGYPTCGCNCIRTLNCKSDRYFFQKTCSCLCKPIYCEPSYVQSSKSCQCKPRVCPTYIRAPDCPSGKIWSQKECECLCRTSKVCTPSFSWDEDSCNCL